MKTEEHLEALRVLKHGVGGRLETRTRKPPCLFIDIGGDPAVVEWDESGCYVVTFPETGRSRRYRTPEHLLRECRAKL